MARRDWGELQKEFSELEKREGMNLTQFCDLKGISRSSAGRHLKTAKERERQKKPTSFKEFSEKKAKGKNQAESEPLPERHFTEDKLMFYVEANNVSRKHADFLTEFFRSDSVQQAAEKLKIPASTAYSYLKNETVQKTIDDVTATAFEVETTTPTRIRGRMCAIANANIKDFFDEHGDFKTPEKWTRTQGLAVRELKIKPTEFGNEYTLKLYDAMAALETLGNVHGLFDKIDEDNELAELSEEELEALINEQEKILSKLADPTDD